MLNSSWLKNIRAYHQVIDFPHNSHRQRQPARIKDKGSFTKQDQYTVTKYSSFKIPVGHGLSWGQGKRGALNESPDRVPVPYRLGCLGTRLIPTHLAPTGTNPSAFLQDIPLVEFGSRFNASWLYLPPMSMKFISFHRASPQQTPRSNSTINPFHTLYYVLALVLR